MHAGGEAARMVLVALQSMQTNQVFVRMSDQGEREEGKQADRESADTARPPYLVRVGAHVC